MLVLLKKSSLIPIHLCPPGKFIKPVEEMRDEMKNVSNFSRYSMMALMQAHSPPTLGDYVKCGKY